MLGIGCAHNHTPAAYITIHRARLLEDGYNHLGLLSTAHFKGVIRVKFINEQVGGVIIGRGHLVI